jgi:3'-phosphoadenosine 5'-phosphosulfate sulfotransferase (PAPS reductase)/FAD synthetase
MAMRPYEMQSLYPTKNRCYKALSETPHLRFYEDSQWGVFSGRRRSQPKLRAEFYKLLQL